MKRYWMLLFCAIVLCLSVNSEAQLLSNNIITPPRAVDWTQAGIPGGLPDGSWTQCGSTVAAYSGSASAINSALANCGANKYVLLGPGTFNLSSSIIFPTGGYVVLRGSGADQTFLSFTGSTGGSCMGLVSLICLASSDQTYVNQPPANIYTWSTGYTQATNQITLSSTSNIKTTASSNPTLLWLNQDETGYSGYPASGSSVDNGQFFGCALQYETSTGCSVNGPDGGLNSPLNNRWEYEITVATAVNSSTGVVTLQDPLVNPQWASSQSPKVWLAQSIAYAGVENLSVTGTAAAAAIEFYNCYGCWVSGVATTNLDKYSVNGLGCSHCQVQNNYFYNNTNADPYGIRFSFSSHDLVQNNITQQIRSSIVNDGPDAGSVFGYNLSVDDYYASDAMFLAFWNHSEGDNLNLWEGNIGPGMTNDDIHGSHLMVTKFRNFFTGWESCANGQCGSNTFKDSQTNALTDLSYSRYANNIGNVLGTPGYHTSYKYAGPPPASNAAVILSGTGNTAVSPAIPTDSLVNSTSMYWGNYDVVSGVRWCGNSSDTGWSATCSSTSEIPTGISPYPNSVPTLGDTGAGQNTMPASFYLSSKPAWFGSVPWPPIGPDVSSGNVGQCTGTLNKPGEYAGVPATSSSQCTGTSLAAAWGGHVNATPALNCYLNVMGGRPDGTGNALTFNASTCYPNSGDNPPAPPTGLTAVVQ